MSTSETHSEKTAETDEEDFKSNIPYFDKRSDAAHTRTNTYDELLAESMDRDNDDADTLNYESWDNEDDDMPENVSRLPSNYTTQPANENVNCCLPPNTSLTMRDIKYDPSEIILQPPSTSALRYNYNYPQTRHMHPPPQVYTHPESQAHSSHTQYPAYPQHSTKFHPNMWYPNTPYNPGGGGYYGQYGPQRHTYYNAGYSPDPVMDMLQLSNSGREARNRAEKNRRDKLNGSIQELSTMVPHVAESPRRVDKTAVLRFAAHGLRLQYVFGETINQQRPQITDSLMRLLDSFFITLTCHGQIILISSSIEQHLGHCQADLYGQNILHITHPEDHLMMKQQLIPTDLESLFDVRSDEDTGEPKSRSQAEEEHIDKKLLEDKRCFIVRLARAGPRSEATMYEVIKLEGSFRRSDAAPRGAKTSAFPSTLQLIRRSRGREDAIPLHTISGNDIVLIAIARIIRPPKIINRVTEANTLEYKTRHLIDGRIIDCDQRIGLVAGYMTDEVRNLSPFTFMHQDDVRWVIVALRQMYDCNSSYGESTYRLLTRNGNFIYLQSKGYLEIDKANNKVHSFVCINTLLDEEEGKRRVQEMKNKFSIIINTKIPQSSIDVPASENPLQLEKAVLCLIQNLQKSGSDDEDSTATELNQPTTDTKMRTHSMIKPIRSSTSTFIRSTKTPPLALVPPEASSVKTSISKSVSVVNVTAAKHLRDSQRVKSPLSIVEGCETRYDLNLEAPNESCTCQVKDGDCKFCETLIDRPASTSIKRSISSDSEDVKIAKRRFKSTEIEHVLSTSLDQIGRSLNQQLSAAIELRDQGNKFEVPNSSQRIDEIMEEHQKQSEIFVNIKSEYEDQIQSKSIETNTTKSSDPHKIEDDIKPR